MKISKKSVFAVVGQAGQNGHRELIEKRAGFFRNLLLSIGRVLCKRGELSLDREHDSSNGLNVPGGVPGQFDDQRSNQHFENDASGEKVIRAVLRHVPGSRFLRCVGRSEASTDNGGPARSRAFPVILPTFRPRGEVRAFEAEPLIWKDVALAPWGTK